MSTVEESLRYSLQKSEGHVRLLVGPLPEGTTSSELLVEIVQEQLLEVSIEGSENAALSFQLDAGVTEEQLQVKFSKKRGELTVSWPATGGGPEQHAAKSAEGAPRNSTAAGDEGELRSGSNGAGGDPGSSTQVSEAHVGGRVEAAAHTGCSADGHNVSATVSAVSGKLTQPGSSGDGPPPATQREGLSRKQQKQRRNNKKKGKQGAVRDAVDVAGLEDLEGTADSLAEQLLSRGYAYVDNFLAPHVVEAILKETTPLHEYFEPGEIWVGKEAQAGAQVARGDVRGDSILWMNFQTMISNNCHCLHRAMRRMDTLVMSLLPRRVPRLAHVSEHSDAMLSLYPPPGSRFQKHIDNTARDGRCLTVLLYLNPAWQPEWGGALRLWPLQTGHVKGSLITTAAQTLSRGEGAEPVELLPVAGRLAMFYSDRVLHEVLPTHRMRHAVTQWYYDRVERAEALTAAAAAEKAEKRGGGRKAGGGGSGVDDQAAAHGFIRALMVDTSNPTKELIAELVEQVECLSPEALRMASEIMGASTPQDLISAVHSFTPKSLIELRDELTRMGQ